MIRLLRDADAEAYVAFRREMLLSEPLAFTSSPGDDEARTPEAVREILSGAPNSVILGVFGPDLIGAAGMVRDRHTKAAHKVHIWGMYVAESYRRQGLASDLMVALIQHARTLQDVVWMHLSVSSAAHGAKRLYQKAGFQIWGTEPDALYHEGNVTVEYHMAMFIG